MIPQTELTRNKQPIQAARPDTYRARVEKINAALKAAGFAVVASGRFGRAIVQQQGRGQS